MREWPAAGRPVWLLLPDFARRCRVQSSYGYLPQGGTGQADILLGSRRIGMFLCLSVEPGTPVTLNASGDPITGDTRDVIAPPPSRSALEA
jgi:hypothetical protein